MLGEQNKHYGLFTTIAMIVGIVIGSGIFFKTDNILVSTNGDVGLGAIVFAIAAISIIFGCLTLKNLAALTDEPGGVIAYSEQFIGKKFASAFGWFQVFVYYPALTAVISWVVGIYIAMLFGWDASLEQQILLGLGWFTICYAFNIFSAKIGGIFQNFSTVVKMIPLISVGVLGVMFGDPIETLTSTSRNSPEGLSWLSAIGPIAFAFDGWVISTAIAFEVKDAKKNLPKALIIAPICILALYLTYYIGISSYIGAEKVIELGDNSLYYIATNFFGPAGAKIVMVFVVISIMGTINGVILGFIRLPYALALKGMLPKSEWISTVNKKNMMPINSAIVSIVISLIWLMIHYFTQKYDILTNSDVSEIAIAMSYLLYIGLYIQTFKFWRKGKIKGIGNGVVFPAFAIIGSLFILTGALQNSLFLIFVAICLASLIAGYIYALKAKL